MKNSPFNRRHQRTIDDEAAGWVVRQERGLTATEQDAFSQWLAVDPHHGAAFAEQRRSWEELDRLNGLQSCVGAVPDPKLLAPRPRIVARWSRIALVPLALAAVVVMMVYLARQPASGPTLVDPRAMPALCEERKLSDGSLLALNRGAAVTVSFTASTREVRLDRGEAHFTVAHDSARPFVVETAGVAVQAVGTAFSVLREENSVAILVTEGKVKVLRFGVSASDATPVVSAGQRAVVSLASSAPAPAITPVSSAEIEERLAWKPRILDLLIGNWIFSGIGSGRGLADRKLDFQRDRIREGFPETFHRYSEGPAARNRIDPLPRDLGKDNKNNLPTPKGNILWVFLLCGFPGDFLIEL